MDTHRLSLPFKHGTRKTRHRRNSIPASLRRCSSREQKPPRRTKPNQGLGFQVIGGDEMSSPTFHGFSRLFDLDSPSTMNGEPPHHDERRPWQEHSCLHLSFSTSTRLWEGLSLPSLMKLWATNEVRAKSKFWSILRCISLAQY
ncbi:uncharacterized protein LOC133815828 [Humulus lupulus]|uniref:uncharacterized protein LOC133815828 n=1 Tax=Humulus lupulus TaxID=3486 RepID=UPI002B40C6EA|nr:uncharacterized protein LOC133815828 [Humulus lupulus]